MKYIVPSRPSRVAGRLITIATPRHLLLNGLWFGSLRPQTVYIYLHGLSGTFFYQSELTASLADKRTAVISFNNRGSGLTNGYRRLNSRSAQGYDHVLGGVQHEVFTDCRDDIAGAVAYARRLGARRIFLIGHSTGCQKSVYYLAHKPDPRVKGAVLLAPLSDYSTVSQDGSPAAYRRSLSAARRLVKAGKPHTLLPEGFWPLVYDAQRFLSLYTPASAEEIFTYSSGKAPRTLNKVKKPLFIFLAENDQFNDRPATEILAWFKKTLSKQRADFVLVKGVRHNFLPRYPLVKKKIQAWARNIK